jgi:RNA polymerase sigma factor (TIGR02999 family)
MRDIESEVAEILQAWSAGAPEALDHLVPVVYESLCSLARAQLRRERTDHMLDAIALVHEAYIKLTELHTPCFRDRSHFLSMVSCVMRRILVDYARVRNAAKRGGGVSDTALEEALHVPAERAENVVDIREALERLEAVDARKARIVEQRYFSGFTLEDIALHQGISLSTVKYELRFARAWLGRSLREAPAA